VLPFLEMLAINFCVILMYRFDHRYVAANEIEREKFIYRIDLLFIDYVDILKIEVL